MVGKLTTHVLDTAHGRPAAGMEIVLWSIDRDSGRRKEIVQIITNCDGRTDTPLLAADEMKIGTYELVFEVGDYFARWQRQLPNPAFLDRVPIQFGIADVEAHYHVPLLVSPWAYSTYRGS